jgi:lipoic acid synthetase
VPQSRRVLGARHGYLPADGRHLHALLRLLQDQDWGPGALDPDEPRRVAESIQQMGLHHAVLTSVNRDEQPDGGAWVFAESLHWIHELVPGCTVEVLIPDFKGDWAALQVVMDARPEILNHNTETVPRLYRTVRPQAKYPRSLELLQRAKRMDGEALTKSGIMVGLGETWDEILQVMDDCAPTIWTS